MKKVFVFVCVVVLVLVSSVSLCFAESVSAGVYVPSSSSDFSVGESDVFISFGSGGFKIGQYSNGEFVVDDFFHDTISSLSIQSTGADSFSVYTDGTDIELIATYSSGSLTNQYYAIQVVPGSVIGVTAEFEAFESLFSPPSSGGGVISSILSSASSFFDSAASIGGGLISWVMSSWVTVIPLVMWVLVALYGVFRYLFKGVR